MSRITRIAVLIGIPWALAACTNGDTAVNSRSDLLRPTDSSVVGVVTDAMTGESMPGVFIRVVNSSNEALERTTFTNGTGEFDVGVLQSPTNYRIEVQHPGSFLTGYPLGALAMYEPSELSGSNSYAEITLRPRALLVLNLAPDRAFGADDRLEIRINGQEPLRYAGSRVPARKFVGIPAGGATVEWTARRGGSITIGSGAITVDRFSAAELDLAY